MTVNVTTDVATESKTASALISEKGEMDAFIRESKTGIEVGTSATYECPDQVCEGCCGAFDCEKNYTVIYDPDNFNQIFCNCVPVTGWCCPTGGCGTLCLC